MLNRAERDVLIMRFFADLSVNQTATCLQIPVGTVKTRTRHALSRIRELGFDGYDETEQGGQDAGHPDHVSVSEHRTGRAY